MKKPYLIILLLCSFVAFGQTRAVSKKVQELNAKNQSFENFNLFTKNTDTQKASKYLTSATDVTILNLNSEELERIVHEAPKYLTVTIPYQNELVNVQLYKQNILTDSFVAKDEKGNVIDYTPGEYYRGIVNGDYTSLVGISFFENDVMGVISTYNKGNIILGKSVDRQDFVTYSDKNLLGENPFECGVDDLPSNQDIQNEISYDPEMASKTLTEKCVKIYYEIAYRPYQLNGSNMDQTLNWITGMHNNVAILYDNDNVNVALHNIMVWTVNDPYNTSQDSPSEILYQFQSNTGGQFVGDVAQLIDYPSTTSIAFVNSLCGNMNVSYVGAAMSYAQVPTYSWNIMAMTHEMGHSFGSPHTHHCSWNGDNTMIDGCGPTAGAPDQGTNCATGPLPTNGGTIMSYCHLIPSVGINFLNGFGDQPGSLIRSTIDSKDCLGTDCSCMFTVQDVEISYLPNGDVHAEIIDNASSEWKYQVYPYGDEQGSNWQTTTDHTIDLSDLANNTYYELLVMNMCDSGSEGGILKNIILTGGFCDGTLFTDTGGENGSYGSNQHFVKTFYPNVDGEKVELSFVRIGLQTNQDFMYVYNGPSTESPLFDEGTITGNNNPGPSFESTDATGAITIEFISDQTGAAYGWEANIDCGILSVEDMSASYGITVYPNPVSDVLNINSQKGQILSVQLTDAAGRTVLTSNVNKANAVVNVSHLPKGVYILSIKMDGKTVTKKVIKR